MVSILDPRISSLQFLIALSLCMGILSSYIEFTNLKCINLDPTFIDVENCRIKAVNRTYKHASVKVNLLEKNVNNVTITFKSMKKANGYKPFLYDITIDACEFMRRPYNPVITYFISLFQSYSNLNHTCPYNGFLLVDKVPASHVGNKMTEVLPFPPGDYALYMIWYAYNKPRADFRVYVSLSDSTGKA